jgi:hypothetical protein
MIPGLLRLPDLDPQHYDQHRKLFMTSLAIIDMIATDVPTLNTLPINHVQFYRSGSTYRLYSNFNNVLYYVALTAA